MSCFMSAKVSLLKSTLFLVFFCVSERVLLRGIFKVGKRSHDVLLTATHLTWSPILPESPAGQAPHRHLRGM